MILLLMLPCSELYSFSSRYTPILKAVQNRDINALSQMGALTLPEKDRDELIEHMDSLIYRESEREPATFTAIGQVLLGTLLTSMAFHYFCHCPQQKNFLENVTSFLKGEYVYGNKRSHPPFPLLTTVIKWAGLCYGLGPLLMYNGYRNMTHTRDKIYDLLAIQALIKDPLDIIND